MGHDPDPLAKSPLPTACSLWRQDDNGNRFLVGRFARREDAEQKMDELTRQLHKQIYWISDAADPEKES